MFLLQTLHAQFSAFYLNPEFSSTSTVTCIFQYYTTAPTKRQKLLNFHTSFAQIFSITTGSRYTQSIRISQISISKPVLPMHTRITAREIPRTPSNSPRHGDSAPCYKTFSFQILRCNIFHGRIYLSQGKVLRSVFLLTFSRSSEFAHT